MINFGMRRGRSVSTALTAIVRHHEVSAAEEALGALQEAAAARQRADRAVERLRAAAAKAAAGAEDAVLRELADCAKEAEKPLKARRGVTEPQNRPLASSKFSRSDLLPAAQQTRERSLASSRVWRRSTQGLCRRRCARRGATRASCAWRCRRSCWTSRPSRRPGPWGRAPCKPSQRHAA